MSTSSGIGDRAAGAILGMASGDALGAGYEFKPAQPDDAVVGMIGGGNFGWQPGEWTDDTSMAVPLLEVAARGGRFDAADLDHVAARWLDWSRTAADVGNRTRVVHEPGSIGAAPGYRCVIGARPAALRFPSTVVGLPRVLPPAS